MIPQPVRLFLEQTDFSFVVPYIQRELPEVELTTQPEEADVAVMLSHVDIYGLTEGEMLDETARLRDSRWHEREEQFRNLPFKCAVVILRLADVIGTGMVGFPMDLAKSIASGRFFHFPGNNACRSVIHTSDVARAVAAVVTDRNAEISGVYNLTDMVNPTIHDIAETLAFRMDNKRISTLSTGPQQWMGRKWYGRRLYALYTSTITFDGSKFCDKFSFTPVPVTEYVRTHVYDHNSL